MGNLVSVKYNGKTWVGRVKSVEAIFGSNTGRDATGRLVYGAILGYNVELLDEASDAIVQLHVKSFSDIEVVE